MKITLKQTMQTQIFHFGMFPLPNIKYGAFSKCTFLAPFYFIKDVLYFEVKILINGMCLRCAETEAAVNRK